MNIRLFKLELRNLSRAPRGRATFALLVILSIAAALFGRAIAAQHAMLGARDEGATREKWIAAETATATVTTFDLAAFRDSFVARGTTPGSALAASDLAALPDSAALRIVEPPVPVPSLAERSPAAILLGTLDLAWLLALLVPLAAIALGFDAIARDRERGTLAMLLAPAPTRKHLFYARGAAIAVVLFAGTAPAAVIGLSAVALLLLAAYAVFLASIVIAVSALSLRVGTALATLIAGWLVVSVAIPLGTAAIVRSAYPLPDPRGKLDGEQAAADVFQKPSAAALDREAEKDPALDPSKGKDGISIQNRYYMLLAKERLRVAKGARHEEDRALRSRAELAEIALWLSPSTIAAASLSALAATGPRERLNFIQDAELHRAKVETFVRDRVVANEAKFADARAWPKFVRPDRSEAKTAIAASILFAVLGAVIALAAAAKFERLELWPTKEDA